MSNYDFKNENGEFVRSIDGKLTNRTPVGYCTYLKHRGWITKNILEIKHCDLKHCPQFHKNNLSHYWDDSDINKRRDSRRKKKYKKSLKFM